MNVQELQVLEMNVQELEVRELKVKEPEVQNHKGPGARGQGEGDQKSNPIVILEGKVDIWMAGTSGAGVLVK